MEKVQHCIRPWYTFLHFFHHVLSYDLFYWIPIIRYKDRYTCIADSTIFTMNLGKICIWQIFHNIWCNRSLQWTLVEKTDLSVYCSTTVNIPQPHLEFIIIVNDKEIYNTWNFRLATKYLIFLITLIAVLWASVNLQRKRRFRKNWIYIQLSRGPRSHL